MSDITAIDLSYHVDQDIQVCKFCALIAESATYTDGAVNPGAANVPCLGIAQESIVPDVTADYVDGQYQYALTGATWPNTAIPSSGLGRTVRTRMFGISNCIASNAITRGAQVNVANTQGLVKAVSETGTMINVVGIAIDAAFNAGDVIRVLVMPFSYYHN
jgi:hypothetical protein